MKGAGISTTPWKLGEALAVRRELDLLRILRQVDGAQGPEIEVDGRRFLAFCSNDYLGLAAHPALTRALKHAADRCGVGSGASALVCGRHRYHVKLEEALAHFTGYPRCLLYSTGYMANLGVASALFNRDDLLVCDQLNHASLIDATRICGGERLIYPHADATWPAKALPSSK